MIDLLAACRRHSLAHRSLVEVGVNRPGRSHLHQFFKESAFERALLIEPIERHAEALRECFKLDERVSVVCAAVCETNDDVELYYADESTFLVELQVSPAILQGGKMAWKDRKIKARGVTFDTLDDGQIDVLTADVEGAEWYILKRMTSRPGLICLETHLLGRPYVNPFLSEIRDWMRTNNYIEMDRDRTDTVWLRRESLGGTLG